MTLVPLVRPWRCRLGLHPWAAWINLGAMHQIDHWRVAEGRWCTACDHAQGRVRYVRRL